MAELGKIGLETPLAGNPAAAGPRVFVSYRRQDSAGYAGNLYRDLRARFGKDKVFQDVASMAEVGGTDWFDFINQTLGASALVLTVIGPQWLTVTDETGQRRLEDPTDVHRKELELALERDVRLIPILVDGARMPRASDLPASLRGLTDRTPHELTNHAWDANVEQLGGMIELIFADMITEQKKLVGETVEKHAREGDFQSALGVVSLLGDLEAESRALVEIAEAQFAAERADEAVSTVASAREKAESLEGEAREQVLESIRALEERWRPTAFSVQESLDAAGLKYLELGGNLFVPFPGERVESVVVNARELTDGDVFFSVELPRISGRRSRDVFQALLNLSINADYVKAIALSEGRYALAAEIPASALTPTVCAGLIWSLVALGDVKDMSDLLDAEGWSTRLGNCRTVQALHITVDATRAREEAHAQLERAGLATGLGYEVNVGFGQQALNLHVSDKVISLIVSLPDVRPAGNKDKLVRLLELNRTANVGKIGLSVEGDIAVFYEVPQIVPDLVERMLSQFAILRMGTALV